MKTLLAPLALAFFAASSWAHDDATLDKVAAPNGGQLRMAGAYHLELVVAKDSKVAKENPVAVYLTDHAGKKLPSAGVNGSATILAGKIKTTVALSPAGDNRLSGIGKYASIASMKVVVSLTFADKSTEQARFTPLAAAADGHAGHQHE